MSSSSSSGNNDNGQNGQNLESSTMPVTNPTIVIHGDFINHGDYNVNKTIVNNAKTIVKGTKGALTGNYLYDTELKDFFKENDYFWEKVLLRLRKEDKKRADWDTISEKFEEESDKKIEGEILKVRSSSFLIFLSICCSRIHQ